MRKDDYWYLATHYSNYLGGMEKAYQMALDQMEILMKAGVNIYCPIVHNHVVSTRGFPATHEYWMAVDRPMLFHCHGIIVVQTPGWKDSRGMNYELDYAKENNKHIVFMEPGIVPERLLPEKRLSIVA